MNKNNQKNKKFWEMKMSADNLYMHKNSMMMIHHAMTGAWGNVSQLRKQ